MDRIDPSDSSLLTQFTCQNSNHIPLASLNHELTLLTHLSSRAVKNELQSIIGRANMGQSMGMGDHMGGMGMGMGDMQQGGIEMLIPGNKVGLIIGKGGETIKQLQV